MKNDAHANDNDNEPNPWSSIGLQAAMIVNKLRCTAQLVNSNEKQNEQSDGDTGAGDADKKRPEKERQYIEHRLREIAAWERKVNGGKKF